MRKANTPSPSTNSFCFKLRLAKNTRMKPAKLRIHRKLNSFHMGVKDMLNSVFPSLNGTPLAYLLANWIKVGTIGVYAAIAIAESLMAIAGIWIFRQGKWKVVKI